MTKDLVSVITPTYNSEKYIGETIKSVIRQTYSNWELVITDDASSDGTLTLVSGYVEVEPRIRFYKFDKNKGPAEARNNSILNSKGRYLAFIDSDDLWEPDKLEKQIQFMKYHGIKLSYTSYRRINEVGKIIDSKISVPSKLNYHDLLKTCDIYCSTVMYDSRSLGKIKMPDIRKRQDFALWLKILRTSEEARGINEVLMSYRVIKKSVSRNKFKAAKYQFKVYYNVEKLSLLKSIYYMIYYMIFGFFKTFFGITRASK